MQKNVLQPNASSDARVFVVWFNMYPGDSPRRWPRDIFPGANVTQRWDQPKTAGKWFLTHLAALHPSHGGDEKFPQDVDAMWDTYILFDRAARWEDTPDRLLSWGYTVVRTRRQLQSDFAFATSDENHALR